MAWVGSKAIWLRDFVVTNWKWLLLAAVVLAGIGWWQYRRQVTNQPELTFEHPVRENLVKTLEVSGVVDAKEKARLRFLAGGKVTFIGAQEGDRVEKWQTIAVIDQATLQKQLQQDLNTFRQERLEWENTTETAPITSRLNRARQQDQLDLDNEVLDVEIRDIAIQNTRLYAPFEGILTQSPTAVTGVQLLSTDYFELINPQTLVFRAEVDESDIAAVALGQETTINLDAHLDTDVNSVIEYIAYSSTETTSGTIFIVELPLDTTQHGLDFYRLGMNGDASIVVDRRENVLTIPLFALIERDDQTFVEVKVGEHETQERQIEVGLETDDKVEVLDGLTTDDWVLIPE